MQLCLIVPAMIALNVVILLARQASVRLGKSALTIGKQSSLQIDPESVRTLRRLQIYHKPSLFLPLLQRNYDFVYRVHHHRTNQPMTKHSNVHIAFTIYYPLSIAQTGRKYHWEDPGY